MNISTLLYFPSRKFYNDTLDFLATQMGSLLLYVTRPQPNTWDSLLISTIKEYNERIKDLGPCDSRRLIDMVNSVHGINYVDETPHNQDYSSARDERYNRRRCANRLH